MYFICLEFFTPGLPPRRCSKFHTLKNNFFELSLSLSFQESLKAEEYESVEFTHFWGEEYLFEAIIQAKEYFHTFISFCEGW